MRHPPERVEPAVQRLRPLHELRRLPLRGARQVGRGRARRAAGARARERRAADERAGGQARDERRRDGGDRGGGRARRSSSSASPPTWSCSPAARPTRPSCLLVSATEQHPQGLANGSDQVGRNYMFHNSAAVLALSTGREPDRLPEDARPERLLLRRQRARLPARQHPDGRQVAGADVPRREAGADQARAAVDARAGGEARGRLLALDRGPADAGEPRHGRRRREADARLHGHERDAEEGAAQAAGLDARAAADGARPPLPSLRVHEERHPGRGRRPPGGHVPDGRRRRRVGRERRLPRARARQPLRRRHERLPEHRRGQPGADRDGELAARRRPPARAPRRLDARRRRTERRVAHPGLALRRGRTARLLPGTGGGARVARPDRGRARRTRSPRSSSSPSSSIECWSE